MQIASADENLTSPFRHLGKIENARPSRLGQPSSHLSKVAGWLNPTENKIKMESTVQRLQIERFQHILEIGYGSGSTLFEVAGKLKVGFLAGVDASATHYQQAQKKNKEFVSGQLLQLHLGRVEDLSYPSHYFHTIYTNNVHILSEQPNALFYRLGRLLKSGGKLVIVLMPHPTITELQTSRVIDILKAGYREAGLVNPLIELNEKRPLPYLSAIGYKP
jgi:ubiquinone/menaquinone biosynthesis C-methylase UbiE